MILESFMKIFCEKVQRKLQVSALQQIAMLHFIQDQRLFHSFYGMVKEYVTKIKLIEFILNYEYISCFI